MPATPSITLLSLWACTGIHAGTVGYTDSYYEPCSSGLTFWHRRYLTSYQQDASRMLKKLILITSLISLTAPAFAATQCGPFNLQTDKSGWFSVNGERAKIQKVTFSKEKGDYDNATIKLLVKNSKAPGMIDMELTNLEGKGMLRAQIVRTSHSQIRLRGLYDCEPAK
ncbi:MULTISPECIES: hypothetical protein [unclassified Pantoea]|uniref:hypothetical protein n=1 Tax=unclassified Pantoea TaxID=2630326 RepID=UPI0023DA5DE7|nr:MULTISPECIES: hypothetical protein [unclassified Pantoea]MDF2041692.1 hypothetical protein [Pantoea sp. Cr_R14]MDF2070745.1 hypothetical protein [Pantoea sp. Cr_R13]MDF2081037.1 hypothetical protein [Pantoea sp. Cr_R21]